MAYNAAMATTIEGPAVMMADEVITSMETVAMETVAMEVVAEAMVVVGANAAGGGIVQLINFMIQW